MFAASFLAIILFFSETRHSNQNQKDKTDLEFLKSDEAESYNGHENFAQVMESEGLILAKSEESDFGEGSGFEGSGSENIFKNSDFRNCVEAGYTAVCSKKGLCINNVCVCDLVELELDNGTALYHHSGRYCEECPYCQAQRCLQYLPCIECHSFQKNSNCNPYCQFQYEIVEKVFRDKDKDEKFCDVENTDGCFFKFKYFFNTRNSVVVQYEKDFFCFDGYKFLIFTFWGVVIYIFVLILLVPRICYVSWRDKVRNSRTSLSRGYDVLRFDLFR